MMMETSIPASVALMSSASSSSTSSKPLVAAVTDLSDLMTFAGVKSEDASATLADLEVFIQEPAQAPAQDPNNNKIGSASSESESVSSPSSSSMSSPTSETAAAAVTATDSQLRFPIDETTASSMLITAEFTSMSQPDLIADPFTNLHLHAEQNRFVWVWFVHAGWFGCCECRFVMSLDLLAKSNTSFRFEEGQVENSEEEEDDVEEQDGIIKNRRVQKKKDVV